jgi:hypothetical protein
MIALLVLALAIGAAKSQPIRNTPVINGIEATDGSEQVDVGTTLNLTCVADYPIEWILPNNSVSLLSK